MSISNFSAMDVSYMQMALEEAKAALAHEDVPVGAVVVHQPTGEVIAVGHNTREVEKSALGHAEINVIRQACQKLGSWRLSDCILYVTLEPCPMCAGAILAARIPKVVCGAKDAMAGAMGSVWALHQHPLQNQPTRIEFGCRAEDAQTLLKDFFSPKRKK